MHRAFNVSLIIGLVAMGRRCAASAMIFIVALSLGFFGLAPARAQSPREQLSSLVQELQTTPDDGALRERIIKLAVGIKPALTIPEEANRAFIKARVFQKDAKDSAGYDLAISAYDQALRIAPWWGDAYFNLAAVLETAGKFDRAIAAAKSYLTTLPPGAGEAREAQNRIYVLEAKDELARKQAANAGAAAEKQRPTVEGKWSAPTHYVDFRIARAGDRFAVIAGTLAGQSGLWRATNTALEEQHVRFTVEQPACPQCRADYDLTLSANGNELVGTIQSAGSSQPSSFNREPN
jgi:tetratricopeptide (TPR) repeat protein